MCLELLIQTAEGAPGRIGAKRLSELSGLAVTPSRLDNKPALHISVSGGRSCEFPAKGAHKHQGVWEFDPMQIPKLTAAVRALNSEVRKYRLLARTDRLVNRRGDGHLHIFPTAQPGEKAHSLRPTERLLRLTAAKRRFATGGRGSAAAGSWLSTRE
jgi:hypothetical protein